MSNKGATQFGKALYKRLVENQTHAERLFEQIYLSNIRNMENKITDEEAQQRMSTELINYTEEISRSFSASSERQMAQGIVPYIMLEYASEMNPQLSNIEHNEDKIEIEEKPINDSFNKNFSEKFRENLEKLKPIVLEYISKHWRTVAGASAAFGITYAVTKFVLGMTANKALLMGGSLGLAFLLGWQVYENFSKKK